MKSEDKELVSQIQEWVQLGKEVARQRQDDKLNPLFKGENLGALNKALGQDQSGVDPKGLFQTFLETYKQCLEEVVTGSVEIEKSGRVADSLASVTKILYFFDMGYELVSSILLVQFSKEEVSQYIPLQDSINQAYPSLIAKRQALFSYLNPFRLIELNSS